MSGAGLARCLGGTLVGHMARNEAMVTVCGELHRVNVLSRHRIMADRPGNKGRHGAILIQAIVLTMIAAEAMPASGAELILGEVHSRGADERIYHFARFWRG